MIKLFFFYFALIIGIFKLLLKIILHRAEIPPSFFQFLKKIIYHLPLTEMINCLAFLTFHFLIFIGTLHKNTFIEIVCT